MRPQTYLAEGPLEGEGSEAGGEGVPVQGCHMLVPGSDPCTACRRFAGDLRYQLCPATLRCILWGERA